MSDRTEEDQMAGEDVFGDLIHTYTRRQALDDGVLVDVSEMAQECGIRWQVAVTREVWERYVCVPVGLEMGQNLMGRLKDLLFMCGWAIRSGRMDGMVGTFRVLFLMPEDTEWLDCEEPRGAAYSIRDRVVRLRLVMLKAVSGPDDDGAPCITLMLTDQD